MILVKRKKDKKKMIIRLVIFLFIGYIVFLLINQQIQINTKIKKLNSLTEQIQIQDIKNNQLREVANSDLEDNKEYIEKIARESLDFSKQGERVFVNMSS